MNAGGAPVGKPRQPSQTFADEGAQPSHSDGRRSYLKTRGPAPLFKLLAAGEPKAAGRSSGRDVSRSQHGAALTRRRRWPGLSTVSGGILRAPGGSHAPASDGASRGVSSDQERGLFGTAWRFLEALLPPIIQHQLNRRGEALQTLLPGPALSVRLRHFGAGGHEPLAVPLNDGRIPVWHRRKLESAKPFRNRKPRQAGRAGRWITLAGLLAASGCVPGLTQPFALESWSIDGGGGTSAGGGFSVSGTIGQPDAGTLSGGGFGLVGGFPGFHVVPAGPMTVALQILADGRVHVTWPGAEAAWQLEAASRLGSSPDWQTVTAPGATSYTAPATGPARFFRLRRQ